MKQFLFLALTILALLALAGCSREADMGQAQLEQTRQAAASAADNIREEFTPQELTESIGAVPEEYFSPAGGPTYDAVLTALKAGYRHIDTAAAYFNEADVGRAVRDSGSCGNCWTRTT